MSVLMRRTMSVAGVALVMTLTACGGQVEDDRPGQPVKHRQDAFKEMLRVSEPMGTMLRTGAYDADRFEAMAQALHALRERPWAYFGDDTNYPPTKALGSVWSKRAEFDEAAGRFRSAVGALAEAAAGRDVNVVRTAHDEMAASCRDCHRAFRRK